MMIVALMLGVLGQSHKQNAEWTQHLMMLRHCQAANYRGSGYADWSSSTSSLRLLTIGCSFPSKQHSSSPALFWIGNPVL
jgi:hypothetical protein